MTPAMLTHSKPCTIYFRGGMGVVKMECRSVSVSVGPYAQYKSAITVRFVGKGQRKERGFVQTYQPSLLVLDGWGHPDPDGIYDESTADKRGEVTTMRGRYSACDPRWQGDFDRMMAAHGGVVLADYRGWDPMVAVAA